MRSPTLTGSAILMATLLSGCGAEPGPTSESAATFSADAAPTTPRHTTTVEPFTESLVNPCNAEVIVFSGEGTNKVTDVRGVHVVLQGSGSGAGIGPESGASYTYNLVFHESFNTPSPAAPQANFFANANARIRSSLPGLSFTAHFVFHAVALPSGEYKVTRSMDRVECKA
jgi:hypothetical protein